MVGHARDVTVTVNSHLNFCVSVWKRRHRLNIYCTTQRNKRLDQAPSGWRIWRNMQEMWAIIQQVDMDSEALLPSVSIQLRTAMSMGIHRRSISSCLGTAGLSQCLSCCSSQIRTSWCHVAISKGTCANTGQPDFLNNALRATAASERNDYLRQNGPDLRCVASPLCSWSILD